MAAAAAVSSPRRQWRYTWEALTHLPLLRLYLFPSPALSSPFPSDLRADLRLQGSLLHLSFSLPGDGTAVALRVPVPRVLVDPSAPVECRAAAAGDHLELRLALVLPVDHPVVAAAFPPPAGEERPASLALRDDLKSLSSGDVHLYCKNCSSRLRKEPLRKIMEMPSVDWEDVADNWFGGCCTSFGGAGATSRRQRATGKHELGRFGMDIAGLPSDILVEVTASIATRSSTPLSDIVNLRRSCKLFRDATAAREVGRCMAVQREWRLHWWDKKRFLSVLRRCAASGNPEASYILGLELFCNRRRKASGLWHLRHAMEHGHAAAAYMIGMIMLHHSRTPGSTERALERLDRLSASASSSSTGTWTRRRVVYVRREALSVMRRLTMRRWRMAEPPTPCLNLWCGKVETGSVQAWDDSDDEERRFCSRVCWWKHEYCKFIRKI